MLNNWLFKTQGKPDKGGKEMKKVLLQGSLLGTLMLAGVAAYLILFLQDSGKTYAQENPLQIPTLIDSLEADNNIELAIQDGAHEFFAGIKSDTKGFGQSYLGPTIRLYKGETTRLTYRNNLTENTTVHGHGLHVSGRVDGGPQGKILAGQSRTVDLPIAQEAGTSWYHPHYMGKTGEQVHAGLAGLYIIEDENSQSLPLPKAYGVDDIPLIIQDRTFVDGKMKPYKVTHRQILDGLVEETLVINGTVNPYHQVPAGWVRLRLLNASNARFYRFFFTDDAPFYKIATEGGFLNKPVAMTSLSMSPGERNEIMVNLADLTSLSLMAEFLPMDPEDQTWFFENPVQRVIDLRVDASLPANGTLPNKLNDIAYYQQADIDTAVRRDFTMYMEDEDQELHGHNLLSINHVAMQMDVINEQVKQGDMELWMVKGEMMPHPFHVHGVSFQIITHNGQPPVEADRGWKDTLVVTEEPTEILMRFDHLASPEFPYMYHCHIFEHEESGMMGQFTVTN